MTTSFESSGVESDYLKREAEVADGAKLESRIKEAVPVFDRPADIKMVELDRVGSTDLGPAKSPAEVKKHAELRREAEMLKQMQLMLDQGANADAFTSWDKANGIGQYSHGSYVRGYVDVYRSYYGPEAIAVEPKSDGTYGVLNGRHRIEAAREAELKRIPPRIVG